MIDPAQLIAFALGLLMFIVVDDLFAAWAGMQIDDTEVCDKCQCTCGEDDDDVTPGEDGHGAEPDDREGH